jgi:hypothetical protein
MLTLSVVFIATRGGAAPVNGPKDPYMIYEGNNTAMTILWQRAATESCTIEWGLDANYNLGSTVTAEYGIDHQHKHTITGLTPGTKYFWNVVGIGSGSFTAAPADSATSVKFLAYGDTRTYPADQNDVLAQMINTYTADPAFQTLSLHSADWVNSDAESDWNTQWFDPAYPNLVEFRKNVPINGCRGNHEGSGSIFSKYYPYPHVNGFYWSFDYGPAHVTVVDQYTDYSVGSEQYNWLENDLATTTKKWKIVLFHEPAWSAGGHGNNIDTQTRIQPLLEQYNVRLVFCGHNHYYARCDVNGVQHMTIGGGGAPLYAPNPDAENLVICEAVHHFAEITIDGDTITVVARRKDGTVIDTYSFSDEPAPPVWQEDPVQMVSTVDMSITQTLAGKAIDPNADPLTYSRVSGPAWLGVAADGTLSGAPTSANLGLNSFVVDVTDGISGVVQAALEITVSEFAIPVAHWKLDDATGSTAIDSSGNEAHGTLDGPSWSTGLDGGAIAFDGNADIVTFGTAPSLSGQTDLTVSAWVKTTYTATGVILQQRGDGGYNGEYQLSLNANGTVRFMLYGNGAYQYQFDTTQTVNDGAWHFIVAVRDGQNGYIYIDDNFTPAASASGTIRDLDATIPVVLGKDDLDNNKVFNGLIDDVRIYDVALSDQEVMNLYGSYPPAGNNAPVFTVDPVTKADATEDVAYTGQTLAGSATDADSDPLTYRKVSGSAWLSVATDGALSGTPGNGDIGFNSFGVEVFDDNGGTNSASLEITVIDPSVPVASFASSESTLLGTVSGSLSDTFDNDDVYEVLTEELSVNKKLSQLEHKWIFNVSGGEVVTFYIEAHHTANAEGDDFIISYSTDDVAYTDIVTITKTIDDNTVQWYSLPNGISGTVYIKVEDADRTDGNTALDSLYVDALFIISESVSGPPTAATSPTPVNGATEQSLTATLAWDAGALAASHDVYFGIGASPVFQGNQTGTTFDPGPLAASTVYYWAVDEVNVVGTTLGMVWSFTTTAGGAPLPGQASNPDPITGARNIVITPTLSWTAGSDAVSHDVYFGTVSGSPTFMGNQTGTTFDPGTLTNKVKHYWRIDEVNATGTTTGTQWSFTTVR